MNPSKYKVSIGYTIWDNVGSLPDLEETMRWCTAVHNCFLAQYGLDNRNGRER